MTDKVCKFYCGEPCKPPNYVKKTFYDRWVDKKPNKPQKRRLWQKKEFL